MLRTKKLIAILMVIVLTVLTLASCGPQKSGSADELKLTVWNTQGTDYIFKDLENDIPSEWLKEKTGVSIQNIYGNDGGQWDSKLTKLHASGNMPDLVWCQSSQGPAHFNKLLELGSLVLLDDEMIKKYAPNIWERTPSYIWNDFRTSDGKIIGIPFLFDGRDIDTIYPDMEESEREKLVQAKASQVSSVQTNLYIRDDILKKIYPECKSYDELMALIQKNQAPIGDDVMDIPIHTTEEFVDFMYKIKEMNLTENGRKVYSFGYCGDGNDNWESLVYLGNMMYGSNWHQYTAHWNTETEKIEIPLMGDLVKEMAKTQNQMILDKVIDPESLAHTGAQFQAKIFQGVYAICSATRAGSLDAINKQIEENGGKFKYRPFWIDIPAPEGYAPFNVTKPFSQSFCILNTLDEDEIIRVLKWADLQFTDEFIEINSWGRPEDGLYVDNEDGTRKYVDEAHNKYFIYGDSSALEDHKTMGLNYTGNKMRILPMLYSKYSPDFMAGYTKLTPSPSHGFKFSNDSKYVTSVKAVPPSYAYSPEFAAIPELIDYWARREEWEIAIKKAIAAQEGEFESKWNEMKKIVKGICDYKAMEEKMTEIAMPYWESIKEASK